MPPRRIRPAEVIFRRALTLLGLTLIAPGSAQVVAGGDAGPNRHKVGRIVLRAWAGALITLILLAIVWLIHREFVLGLFTHQLVLRTTALLLLVTGLGWPMLTFDAWHLRGVQRLPVRPRRLVAGLAGLLLVTTFAVPLEASRQVWAAADLLHGVFGSQARSGAAGGRYNVLLLGGDAGPDRIGTRPDSVTLASIDASTGRTVLIGLPRNLQNVPFLPGTPAAAALPKGWSCGDECLLNAIYTWGSEHRQYFPGVRDPGAEAMKQAVASVTGLKVNYYLLIDLRGFRAMIDAVGGIDINVVAKVPIGGETSPISGWIMPGKRHLNGFHALWYARSRTTTSDYDRMARQRCVMSAMVNQLDPKTLLSHFEQIAAASSQVVSTDIPAAELPQFLTLGQEAKRRRIESVQFVPPLIVPRNPNFDVIRRRVAAVIADSERHGDQVPGPATPSALSTTSTGTGATRTTAGATRTPTRTVATATPGANPTGASTTGPARTGPAKTGPTTAGPTTAGSTKAGSTKTATPRPSAPGVDVRQVCQAA